MTSIKQQKLVVLAEPKKKTFWADDSGAISVDHVVLTGAVIGIALLAVGNFAIGAEFLANDRKEILSSYQAISSTAENDTSSSTVEDNDTGNTDSAQNNGSGNGSSNGSGNSNSGNGSGNSNGSGNNSGSGNNNGSNNGTNAFLQDQQETETAAAFSGFDYLMGGVARDVQFG